MQKKRRDMFLDAPNCQFPLLQQVALIGAQMLRAKLLGRLAKVPGEPLHETQVAADGGVGVVTATLYRTKSHSEPNAAAEASPAASF